MDSPKLVGKVGKRRESALGLTIAVKILSLNTFLRPPGVKTNASDHKNARVERLMWIIEDFDIICFQECFGSFSSRRDRIIAHAKERGFVHTLVAPLARFGRVDGGLCVLSRFPIMKAAWHAFPRGVGPDKFAEKGVLYSKVVIDTRRVHVFTTHLQASYTTGREAAEATRLHQLELLSSFVQSCVQGREQRWPVVIVGDMNVDAHNFPKEYDAMVNMLQLPESHDFQDVLLDAQGEHPITFGDVVQDEPREVVLTGKDDWCSCQSLDYIFVFAPRTPASSTERKQPSETPTPFSELGVPVEMDAVPLCHGIWILEKSARVMPFFVQGQPFTQLSDHYGVTCTLLMRKDAALPKHGKDVEKM